MAKYSNHSRFFYANYKEIQDNINLGNINEWDIVICSDTQEQILVTDKFELVVIKSRVYRFVDVESAETFLNKSSDSYEGQIVSILSTKGNYAAYIVNKNNIDKFTVQPISVYEAGDLSYSDLGERPIDNLESDVDHPAILAEQETGIYKISGAYKLSSTYPTVFQSSNANIYLVTQEEDETLIKVITSSEIIDYVVGTDGEILEKSLVPTTTWLEEQNYINEEYLDNRLAALNIMTKEETQAYIRQLLDDYVITMVDDELDKKLTEKLVAENEESITKMFYKNK